VPEASGRARDALDKAFNRACAPDVPPSCLEVVPAQVRATVGG